MRTRTLVGGFLLLACSRASGPAPAPAPGAPPTVAATRTQPDAGPRSERLARALPDAAPPFIAGPLIVEASFARRRYTRGATTIEITIAFYPQGDGEFTQWIAQSRAYPRAALPLSASEANGFFSCVGPGTVGTCDLHIQLRGGFHIEVMGGGRATRDDLDLLMTRIPLARLVRSL